MNNLHKKWGNVCNDKYKNIKDKFELWKSIEDEIGKSNFKMIKPLFDQEFPNNLNAK